MSSLKGKSIVITGSGGGIGAAYAQLVAREGASVVVNDLEQSSVDSTVGLIEADGGRAIGVVGSVADSAQAASLVDACVTTFGSIDGLVNNAGVMIIAEPDDLDEERTRQLLEVNVLGSIFCGVHAMRRMRQQGAGVIVNVTSGSHMGLRASSVYGASKGAIASLTYGWAIDLAGTGIRVNAVSPMAGTQMAADVLRFQGVDAERLSGFPAAADNAPVVAYLLSDQSAHVHGQVIRIDAGEISVVGRPAIMRPSVSQDEWDVAGVAKAFENSLNERLNPLGLLQVKGEFAYTTVKSDA
jgi:NAD(P)-dependent dehydrogenase (short-subunit alcohol dehydrogenase family)